VKPSKKEVMLALLERAEARVHLDARRDGVTLPPRFRAEGSLRLDYSYSFSPPIPDLVVDDEGIHATLSFNRVAHHTFVPWSAVYLISDYDGNGAVWQEDIPPDILDAAPPTAGDKPAPAGPAARPAPALKSIDHVDDGGGDDRPDPPAKPPRPSHLKLVK
jgi:stringent starvation protein B